MMGADQDKQLSIGTHRKKDIENIISIAATLQDVHMWG
jgi:hypothetical protein